MLKALLGAHAEDVQTSTYYTRAKVIMWTVMKINCIFQYQFFIITNMWIINTIVAISRETFLLPRNLCCISLLDHI